MLTRFNSKEEKIETREIFCEDSVIGHFPCKSLHKVTRLSIGYDIRNKSREDDLSLWHLGRVSLDRYVYTIPNEKVKNDRFKPVAAQPSLVCHASQVKWAGYIVEGRKALEGREKILGHSHPDTLWAMQRLAEDLEGQGHVEEAAGLQQRALKLQCVNQVDRVKNAVSEKPTNAP